MPWEPEQPDVPSGHNPWKSRTTGEWTDLVLQISTPEGGLLRVVNEVAPQSPVVSLGCGEMANNVAIRDNEVGIADK